jgi:hypothetical protein
VRVYKDLSLGVRACIRASWFREVDERHKALLARPISLTDRQTYKPANGDIDKREKSNAEI